MVVVVVVSDRSSSYPKRNLYIYLVSWVFGGDTSDRKTDKLDVVIRRRVVLWSQLVARYHVGRRCLALFHAICR